MATFAIGNDGERDQLKVYQNGRYISILKLFAGSLDLKYTNNIQHW